MIWPAMFGNGSPIGTKPILAQVINRNFTVRPTVSFVVVAVAWAITLSAIFTVRLPANIPSQKCKVLTLDFAALRMSVNSRPALFALMFLLGLFYAMTASAGAPSLSDLKAQGKSLNGNDETERGKKNKDQQEALKKAHHQRSKACFQCHQNSQSSVFKQQMRTACLACHPEGWYKGKLIQLQKGVGEAASLEHPEWPHAKGRGPGMQFDMYYPHSRLGDNPNDMIKIPAGKFLRGTDERLPDEGPQHTLMVKTFYIDKYEVTNLQYLRFITNDGKRPLPKQLENDKIPPGKEDHPVTYVSWYDAKAYCAWAGKRLPSDIEWEKAARGTDGRNYPWGNEFSINKANSPVRWSEMKLIGDTTPVGSFEQGKSVYGVYDMSGNVWEWTSSRYEAYPGNTRKSENYGGNYRTLKGGSWWDCSFYQCGISAPVYNRSFFHPKTKNNSFGFRCAKDG